MTGASFSSTKGGMARAKITPKPSGSTFQPMMSSVSSQVCSTAPSTAAMPPSVPRMQAAAPSPNKAVATMFAFVSSSSRKASVHSSTATSSTIEPGRASARRAAIDSPETPPAQPRPKTGTRMTSARKPMRARTRASRLGVAMPVDETVTTQSTSPAVSPALSSASPPAATNRASAPSR